jgi:hypothetical protein
MVTFKVIVTCLVTANCPIPSGITRDIEVETQSKCHQSAALVIAGFGYSPRDFRIKCEPK